MYVCLIQHPLPSTALNAHGTNCSADGFYARTHINEPYLCYYVVCRSKLAEADAETCVFTGPVTQAGPRFGNFQNFEKNDRRFFVSLPGTSTSIKIPEYTLTFFFCSGKNSAQRGLSQQLLSTGRPTVYLRDMLQVTLLLSGRLSWILFRRYCCIFPRAVV